MGPVYRKIPGGRLERKIREQLQKVLDQTVGAGVGAAWKAVTSTIDGQKATLESGARAVLGELFAKQAELKNKIKEAILGVVSPPLEEISKPVMKPVCDCLMAPLVASYKELVFSFFERTTKACRARGCCRAARVHRTRTRAWRWQIITGGVKADEIKEFAREIRWFARGCGMCGGRWLTGRSQVLGPDVAGVPSDLEGAARGVRRRRAGDFPREDHDVCEHRRHHRLPQRRLHVAGARAGGGWSRAGADGVRAVD